MVGDAGFEPVISSVSGKSETLTRVVIPHLYVCQQQVMSFRVCLNDTPGMTKLSQSYAKSDRSGLRSADADSGPLQDLAGTVVGVRREVTVRLLNLAGVGMADQPGHLEERQRSGDQGRDVGVPQMVQGDPLDTRRVAGRNGILPCEIVRRG